MRSFINLLLLVLPKTHTAALPEPVRTDTLVPRVANGDPGFDISVARNRNFFTCMRREGYKKVAIRIYQQACGRGGQIDTGFLTSYNNAKAAGFTAPSQIDAYMFPCTGSQPTGVACKPIKKQIEELLTYLKNHRIQVHRLWLDLEPTRGECNAWQLSKTANFNLAKDWVAALKRTGLKWGIYANPNQWDGMFPSRSSNIGSDLPLWVVIADDRPGVGTVSQGRLMGGWSTNKLLAKQWKLDTTVCGGKVDKDSFINA